jgi:Rap1a immunity proteins
VAKLFTQSSILALAVVGLCVWFSKATKAQSANELAEVCKKVANKVPSDASDFQRGVCAGQVTALAWVAPDLTGRLRSCSPLEATRLQVIKVVVAYLDRHPDQLHEPFAGLVL